MKLIFSFTLLILSVGLNNVESIELKETNIYLNRIKILWNRRLSSKFEWNWILWRISTVSINTKLVIDRVNTIIRYYTHLAHICKPDCLKTSSLIKKTIYY
jgi:hypothetical protein